MQAKARTTIAKAQEVSVSILIKGSRQILANSLVLICTFLSIAIVWRGVVFGDLMATYMCMALGFSLFFTGIALLDYRKSPVASDNGL